MRIRMTPAVLLLALTSVVGVAPSAANATQARSAQRAAANTDWPAYHGSRGRSGYTSTMPRYRGGLHVSKRIRLDGAVYASPLVARGLTIVATENDTVYAYNSSNQRVWRRHLGSPSPQSERPCGDIDPLGITSTPVYYSKTGLVYVAAEFSGSPPRHRMIGLSLRTGAVKFTRSIDLSGADSRVMQLRGALTIAGGRVWGSFGALAGDCGNYKGRVVGVRFNGSGAVLKYDPSTRPRGGIWNVSGPTVDTHGHLFLVSANGSSFPGDAYDHTNSVDEITYNGHRIDSFAPTDWAQNNQGDVGLGSQGVAFVGKWAVLGGKSGPVYVLRRSHLGGIGGQVSVQNICKSFGGAAVVHTVVYLPCTDGVRAVHVDSKGRLHVEWHAPASVTGSPSVGGGRVWALDSNAGVLHSLDPRTGHSRAHVTVGQTNRFATPALSGHRILVGTLTGLTIARY